MEPNLEIVLRSMGDDEIAFVIDSWAREFGDSHCPSGLARWIWHRAYRIAIAELLSNSTVVIACMKDVPDEILGWCAWEDATDIRPMALHFVYVKGYARRQGVGTALVEMCRASGTDLKLTHRTALGRKLMAGLRPADSDHEEKKHAAC